MKEELTKLLDNAYAPYSTYKVASAVKTTDGHIFYGVNVENASYGASICAERSAITNAITNGYKKNDLNAIYLLTSSNKIAYPCFLCRQVISEFFTDDANLIIYSDDEDKIMQVKDLMPYPFTKEDLELWNPGL